jgi:4-hydroxy-tetrahydrodipicolinate synthase
MKSIFTLIRQDAAKLDSAFATRLSRTDFRAWAVSRAALAGDFQTARRLHLALLPLYEAMFVEANPGPVKCALALRGAMRDTVRGPLAPVTEATRKVVAAAIAPFAGRS